MSEAERKRRSDYKKNRSKWMLIQLVAIAVITAILLGSFVTYRQLNKTYYIDYTESGDIDYRVNLKENEFYDEDVMEKGQSYVASLIDAIDADLTYRLNMNTAGVKYEYSYRVDAQLEIVDDQSGAKIYAPTYPLTEEKLLSTSSDNQLVIRESVSIDYHKYNDLANKFNTVYDLEGTTSTLVVSMYVDVVGSCDAFEQDAENDYVVSLRIPLTGKTVNIKMTTSVPEGESKVLACRNGESRKVFMILAIVFAILDVLAVAFFIGFVYLTRNEDINYGIKVKKLFNNYRSYIQQINNEFDTNGYQLLYVNTFNEMLGIRDTIQSPILMYENGDQTCTQFLIPTNTKILYIFEIRVEDYDDLYGEGEPTAETPAEASVEEPSEGLVVEIAEVSSDDPLILTENVDEAALEEALHTPDVELKEIEYEKLEEVRAEDGVEVISVVWPERARKNKVYRYDPDGEKLDSGDIVLVPSRDKERNRDIIRKAAVAEGNHRVDPASLHHPLKKIIGVVRRHAERMLTPDEYKKKEK